MSILQTSRNVVLSVSVLKNLCHNDQMIQFGSLSELLDGIPLLNAFIQDAAARAVASRATWGDCADKTPLHVAKQRVVVRFEISI